VSKQDNLIFGRMKNSNVNNSFCSCHIDINRNYSVSLSVKLPSSVVFYLVASRVSLAPGNNMAQKAQPRRLS
jgi:hypothetical protein